MIAFTFFVLLSSVLALQSGRRIVGGDDIPIEKVPYQVSLQSFGEHSCGGSILSSSYVVTAAHCTDLFKPEQLSVRVGTSTRDSGGQVVNVTNIYIHPDYYPILYDISIVKLAENLEFNDKIAPIGLPSQFQYWPAGTEVLVTGWGVLEEFGDYLPENLQGVTVELVDRVTCKNIYNVADSMFCAGVDAGGKDACTSDSGGPLQAEGILVGIVSYGHGCARAGYPGIYTNVSYVRDFIHDVTGL